MAYLRIVRDGQLEGQVALTGTIIRIGRDASNDVVLEDPTKWVSRSHAEIRVQGSTYTIVDLGTPNGIRINRQQAAQAILSSGTSIEIGPYQLQFVADSPAPVAAGDVTVLSPGKGTRAAAPPVAGRAQVPPVPVPRQPMGKIARQALTFVGIVIVVAVVATIDAQRRVPDHPVVFDTGSVPAPPAPTPPPPPEPTPPEQVGQTPTPGQVTANARLWEDKDIPRNPSETDPDWERRTKRIQWLRGEAQDAYDRGRDPTKLLDELYGLQSTGYRQSRELRQNYSDGLAALQKARDEEKKLSEAQRWLKEAQRLLGKGFESLIAGESQAIEQKLAARASGLYAALMRETFPNAARNEVARARAVSGLQEICDLLAETSDLWKDAQRNLNSIR